MIASSQLSGEEAACAGTDPDTDPGTGAEVWNGLRRLAKKVWCTALGIVAGCLGTRICAAVWLCVDVSDRLPLPSAPQITRRIGKSFAQLLTSRAVLIAAGLAAVGGGRGWMFCRGAVDVRCRGGAGRGGGIV